LSKQASLLLTPSKQNSTDYDEDEAINQVLNQGKVKVMEIALESTPQKQIHCGQKRERIEEGKTE
jgi:hypothetical protein